MGDPDLERGSDLGEDLKCPLVSGEAERRFSCGELERECLREPDLDLQSSNYFECISK